MRSLAQQAIVSFTLPLHILCILMFMLTLLRTFLCFGCHQCKCWTNKLTNMYFSYACVWNISFSLFFSLINRLVCFSLQRVLCARMFLLFVCCFKLNENRQKRNARAQTHTQTYSNTKLNDTNLKSFHGQHWVFVFLCATLLFFFCRKRKTKFIHDLWFVKYYASIEVECAHPSVCVCVL